MRAVTVIGAPTSAAAYAPGQEDGPAAMREHGLLAALGGDVVDAGDVERFRWRPDPRPAARRERGGRRRARQAGRRAGRGGPARTARARARRRLHHRRRHDRRADRPRRRPGLVYLDRHADLNVPASTIEGALDWMGVAHLLDVEGATHELAGIAGARPMLTAGRLAFLALAPVTPFETAEIERRRPHVVGLDSGDRRPGGRRARGARGARRRRPRRPLRRRRARLPRRAAGREHRSRAGAAAGVGREGAGDAAARTRAWPRSR